MNRRLFLNWVSALPFFNYFNLGLKASDVPSDVILDSEKNEVFVQPHHINITLSRFLLNHFKPSVTNDKYEHDRWVYSVRTSASDWLKKSPDTCLGEYVKFTIDKDGGYLRATYLVDYDTNN